MRTNPLLRKGLVVAIIVLLGVSSVPVMSNVSRETQVLISNSTEKHYSEMMVDPREINVTISGTMGSYGWYVSSVVITITGANRTYYSLDNATWTFYVAPITVTTDGIYALYVYYVDQDGEYHYFGPFSFKIDKTPPTLNVTVQPNFWKTIWKITVNISDATSGLANLAFYIDDLLVENISILAGGPCFFTFIYWAKGKLAQFVVYDNAGNYANSSSTPCIQQQSSSMVQQTTILRYDLILSLIMRLQMKAQHLLD
jgi:hypothetical protein